MLMLVVNVKLKPGMRDEFIAVISEDAESTSTKEPGNFGFTVIQDTADPDNFYFLEVYKDEAALEEHRKQPHFLKYREASAHIYEGDPMRVIGKNVFPPDSFWMK